MTNAQSSPAASNARTGLDLLIEWANEQDHWVRAIVGEVVAARREVPEASVAAAYLVLLAEKGLSSEPAPNVPMLATGAMPAEKVDELRLVRLADVAGVNALASGQEISFNAKLTVLFGENAVGKTGYVRVLKRVASVRSAQPILGDVRASRIRQANCEFSSSGPGRFAPRRLNPHPARRLRHRIWHPGIWHPGG